MIIDNFKMPSPAIKIIMEDNNCNEEKAIEKAMASMGYIKIRNTWVKGTRK